MSDSVLPLAVSEAARHFSPRQTHLDTAATGLPPASVTQVLIDAVQRWSRGDLGVGEAEVYAARARAQFARLVHVPVGCVANPMYGPPLRLAASARRFDPSPAWLPWLGCAAALDFAARLDIDEVHAHDIRLASLFLERAGIVQKPSAIISLNGTQWADALRASNMTVTRRSGATRLSFHLYNSEAEVIRAAEVVRAAR